MLATSDNLRGNDEIKQWRPGHWLWGEWILIGDERIDRQHEVLEAFARSESFSRNIYLIYSHTNLSSCL